MTDKFEELFGAKQGRSFVERTSRPDAPAPGGAEPAEETSNRGTYKAFGYLPANNFVDACEVQSWLPGTLTADGTVFSYRFLMRIGFVGEEHLRLFLTDCIIVIEGQNLHELRKKLARRLVTFIAQHNPLIWPVRPPEGEPLIERVEVVRTSDFLDSAKRNS